MKIYIAGKITGVDNYKEIFGEAEARLKKMGFTVMNPAILPYPGFEHNEYMQICLTMIDVCDAVCLLDGWEESTGACMEFYHANSNGKLIIKYTSERDLNAEEEKTLNEAALMLIAVANTTLDSKMFIDKVLERLTERAQYEG